MAKSKPARKVSLILLGEKPISWNLLYAGKMTWRQRSEEAARVHLAVRCALDPDWPMFTAPVEIEIRVFFKNKVVQLDWANIPAKMYEDGLIGWIIEDDSPEFVRGGRVLSLLDRDNPRVEIDIFEILNSEVIDEIDKEATTPVMAQWVADNTFPPSGARILDPCAGIGSLLYPLMELVGGFNFHLEAIELSAEAFPVLRKLFPSLDARHADAFDHIERIEGTADFVLMNPPFGAISGMDTAKEVCQSGAKLSQHLFLELAIRSLKWNGTGVIIAPANLIDRMPKKAKRWFDDNMSLEQQHKGLPGEFALTKIKVDAFFVRRISEPESKPEPAPVPAFRSVDQSFTLGAKQLALF